MKITWLGQAGLLFETNNIKVIVDPYLSDSVEKIQPHNKRRVPVNTDFLGIKPDIIVLTHNHLDHTDPETLSHFLDDNSEVCVLASYNAWQTVRKFGGLKNNYVMFNRGTLWTQCNIEFEAVYAEHSDDSAIGVIMTAEGKKYYITGDTLYNKEIFKDLPENIDYVFLPVNGRGNNMNMTEAKAFCEKIGAKAIPLHCGLFDDLDMNNLEYTNKVVPNFYEEIKL
ncbi:MAG: MBL fold metallo-hydrolase [Clostridia bacterium]|nr:MBL fold metallo-hydrolase [Clostridia bacterium]